MAYSLLFVILGVAALILGSDVAIAAASRLARRLNISELVIGLTIVAIGTSLPELATTLTGAISAGGDPSDHASGVAIGNILGSNLFMLTALLGFSALLRPFSVPIRSIRREGLVLSLFTLGLFWPFWIGSAGRAFGLVALGGFAVYLVHLIRTERLAVHPRAETDEPEQDSEPEPEGLNRLASMLPLPPGGQQAILIFGGLAVVVGGSTLVVQSGVSLAEQAGISGTLIGLFVGATTSLPEVFVSIRAASRGTTDLAIGNILGSSITNLGLCLGLSAVVSPIALAPEFLTLDYPFLIAGTATALLLMWNRQELSKKEGATLLMLFTLYLVIRTSHA